MDLKDNKGTPTKRTSGENLYDDHNIPEEDLPLDANLDESSPQDTYPSECSPQDIIPDEVPRKDGPGGES